MQKNLEEYLTQLSKFLDDKNVKSYPYLSEILSEINKEDDYIVKGDLVKFDTQDSVGNTGTYFGFIDRKHLVQLESGAIYIATKIEKIKKTLTKQEAKNKVSNILETQLNPKIIQKIVDIIDRIQ